MADTDSILKEIQRLENEAYQRGWNDAVEKILAAASSGGMPANEPPAAAAPPSVSKSNGSPNPEMPVIELIYGIIKERPGLRGADVFREAVTRMPGSNFKTMDRSGRTALSRLKERGRIIQRSKKWYPKKELEENN